MGIDNTACTAAELLHRYNQAQAITQGILSKRLVCNDAVFSHWLKSPDGKDTDCFWYRRDTAAGKVFRFVNANRATNTQAFDHNAMATALAAASQQDVDPIDLPISVTSIALNGDLLPDTVYFSAFQKNWLFNSQAEDCEQLLPEKKRAIEGLVSPDGKKTAFVRDYNLWVYNHLTDKEYALTEDGCADNFYATDRFLTPIVHALWSPDSQRLLSYRLDRRHVASTPTVQHVPLDGSLRPQLTEEKVSYDNDREIECYNLVAIDIETCSIQSADYSPLALTRNGYGFFSAEKMGWWRHNSTLAYLIDIERGTHNLRVVEFDTTTGLTRTLFEERASSFIKHHLPLIGEPPVTLPLAETDELVWLSERNGYAHLYLYSLENGQLKNAITGAGSDYHWHVHSILHIDYQRRQLLIQTTLRDPQNPFYRDLCWVNLDTGELTTVLSGSFECTVYNAESLSVTLRHQQGIDSIDINGVAPSGNYIVCTRSRVDTLPVSELIDRDGRTILTLETADTHGLPEQWQWPEPTTVTSADGKSSIYTVVFRPPGFSSRQRYPVLDFSMTHPAFAHVPRTAFGNGPGAGTFYLEAIAYAALGFIVVMMDGPGETYRRLAINTAASNGESTASTMGSAFVFNDRVAGLQQLADRYAYMDLERLGVVSWLGIGDPIYALLEYPDIYKVAVVSDFEDNRFMPSAWGEIFKTPAATRLPPTGAAPELCYAEHLVESLQGKLLLMHGMLDPEPPITTTMRLIHALKKANKDFDLLLMPSLGHGRSSYAIRRTWDYLVSHLQGLQPPKNFKLTTTDDLLANEL